MEISEFLTNFYNAYIPLFVESNLHYWNASTTGKPEDWEKHEAIRKKINLLLSNKSEFSKLSEIYTKCPSGTLQKRELEIIYLLYKGNQVDSKKLDIISIKSAELEKLFNNFRANYKGKLLNDNEIDTILKNQLDSAELKEAWEAQKKIGEVVSEKIIELVKLRNEIAIEAGYKNYFEMTLKLSELEPDYVLHLFDELDSLTEEQYKMQKNQIDLSLSERYKIPVTELMPWHYQDLFFQYPPSFKKSPMPDPYKDKDLISITTKFYKGINLDISQLLEKSDLFQKPGKHQQAFHLSVDRKTDIRALANIQNNTRWMGTLLHEFAHCAFDYNINSELPFILREPAHIFITEGIAMLFGRLVRKPLFMQKVAGITQENSKETMKASKKGAVISQLIFNKWSQVMFRFEKALYEDCGQDLNKLWWDLVEKYQLMKRPKMRNSPDWATKIHIVNSPCYYHNYLLGHVFAAQINYSLFNNIIQKDHTHDSYLLCMDYAENINIGNFLKEKVFFKGHELKWNELVEYATGEKLNPKFYLNEINEGLN